MSDEISFGYLSGHVLTYAVYLPDGSVRTAAGTALPETGTTGYYHATNASIQTKDRVIVKDTTSTYVVGWGEYKPEVSPVGVSNPPVYNTDGAAASSPPVFVIP